MKSSEIISTLSKHLSLRRLSRLKTVLSSRIVDTTIVFENLGDPHNIAACLRTADALGIQDGTLYCIRIKLHFLCELVTPVVCAVHVVERWNDRFFPSQHTSQGAAKWLTLHRYTSTREWCVGHLAIGF